LREVLNRATKNPAARLRDLPKVINRINALIAENKQVLGGADFSVGANGEGYNPLREYIDESDAEGGINKSQQAGILLRATGHRVKHGIKSLLEGAGKN